MSHLSKTSKLLAVLNQHEETVNKAIAEGDVEVTCKRGCTHCCYMLTSIHMLEGRLIAEELLSRPHWRRVAARIAEAAKAGEDVGMNRGDYLKRQIPCPFLDLETKDCTVYDVRPSVCRNYFVASPPEKCAPDYEEADVRILNTNMMVATAMKFCVDITGQMVVAPIALMVLWCMASLVNSKEKKRFFEELTAGLPDPVQWTEQARGTFDGDEDTTQSREAMRDAFDHAFGVGEPS